MMGPMASWRPKGGGSSVLWTPLNLGAALIAWWDASQGVTQSGGAVSAWADRVGSFSLAQATGGFQPIYSATSLNSVAPGITFDGVDDALGGSGAPASLPSGTAAGWMCVLLSQLMSAGTTGNKWIAGYGTTGTFEARGLGRTVTSGTNRAQAFDNTVGGVDVTIDFSGIGVLIGTFDSAVISGSINGALFSNGSHAFNTTRSNLYLGRNPASAAQFSNSAISQALFGSGSLSAADRQRLEGWALWSCAKQALLPGGHPYVSAPP